jgi:predicted AAA+ superfamily ATPase
MDNLFEKQERLLKNTSTDFTRLLIHEIDWTMRLIGIKGARGVGKSTLLLQYIKMRRKHTSPRTLLYVSLDQYWFSHTSLYTLAEDFVKQGGEHLFLDEVHKYENWAQEIKNIYDDFPELKVVFTGSSLLEILNARADLSRRAVVYNLQGLSYREYLNFELGTQFQPIAFSDILSHTTDITGAINEKIKPLAHFNTYLKQGYFPFYKESKDLYSIRLAEIINMILDIELPLLRNVEVSYLGKLKVLLQIIAASVPFVPNVSKLSEKTGVNRNTLVQYLYYLEESGITKNLTKDSFGISKLQKPNKVYLENTNFAFTIAPENTNVGNLRETFFLNQLSYQHKVNYTEKTDFIVDDTYFFEIGGAQKNRSQIQTLSHAFIVSDGIEYGTAHRIPLWLFGFLY